MLPPQKAGETSTFCVLRQAVQVCVSTPRQGCLGEGGVWGGLARDLGVGRV